MATKNPFESFYENVGNIGKDFKKEVTKPFNQKSGAQLTCESKGGKWDELNQRCILPETKKQTPEQPKQEKPKDSVPAGQIEATTTKGEGTMLNIGDKTYFGNLSAEEINKIAQDQAAMVPNAQNISPTGTAQAQLEQQIQAQQLAQQTGQFEQLGVNPTGLDFGEAATTGLINAIPRALSYGVTGALAGGALGGAAGTAAAPLTGGISAPAGAVIGAVGGFVSGITSSMIGNFKSQRTDTTTAQQRVLDEGKQNLNDWATLAASDPANRAFYVSNFNKQLALIDQAYRQMKLDTSRDVAKFETALPNLAEFESFYNAQGERDNLVERMRVALATPQDPDYSYQIAELAERRSNK